MNQKKVAVGLSGGVDSSVAAVLLIEQGYEVSGVYLECYNAPGCRTDQDKADALKVAIKLGISFQVLDFRNEYREKVIEYFYREYEAGRTPNPDVMCNREIKFGIFYNWAIDQGYDYVATGHYCRIKEDRLQRAKDESKDQSYFLWQLPQDHLSHILFPLGAMLKSEVRIKAKTMGLITADKPDSMGICFIGDIDTGKLLKDRLGEKVGDVVMQGSKIGTHKGLWFYTIGQRGGWEMSRLNHSTIKPINQLGINLNNLPPLYVIGKNLEKNELVVGERKETMKVEFRIQTTDYRLQDVGNRMQESGKLWVRIRNLGELVEVEKIEGDTVTLCEKIFGVAEGQSAVFYDEDKVLVGGSIIV